MSKVKGRLVKGTNQLRGFGYWEVENLGRKFGVCLSVDLKVVTFWVAGGAPQTIPVLGIERCPMGSISLILPRLNANDLITSLMISQMRYRPSSNICLITAGS